jgi:hypothetical protein
MGGATAGYHKQRRRKLLERILIIHFRSRFTAPGLFDKFKIFIANWSIHSSSCETSSEIVIIPSKTRSQGLTSDPLLFGSVEETLINGEIIITPSALET